MPQAYTSSLVKIKARIAEHETRFLGCYCHLKFGTGIDGTHDIFSVHVLQETKPLPNSVWIVSTQLQ